MAHAVSQSQPDLMDDGADANTSADADDAKSGPMKEAERVLADTFGYQAFRSHQRDIVETVIGGGDALVLMPTGGGKSLCYQVPAIVRPGVGVVVSPLIALMQDQVEALAAAGVSAAFLNSSQDFAERLAVEEQVREGTLDLL